MRPIEERADRLRGKSGGDSRLFHTRQALNPPPQQTRYCNRFARNATPPSLSGKADERFFRYVVLPVFYRGHVHHMASLDYVCSSQ